MKVLFEPHLKDIRNTADRYIEECQKIIGPECRAIYHSGYRYAHTNAPPGKRIFFQSPEPMKETFNTLVDQQKRLEDDMQWVQQTLSTLLKPYTDMYDIRNHIPDCIIDCFPPEVRNITRTIPEQNYEFLGKGMELIQYYSAARLIM